MNILKELQSNFPKCWFKPGNEFDGGQAAVWTGEGSMVDVEGVGEMEAFNNYEDGGPYEIGVLVELNDFCEARGYRWEAHDAGTWLLYKE